MNDDPMEHYLKGYEGGLYEPTEEELEEWANFQIPTVEEVEQMDRDLEAWEASLTPEQKAEMEAEKQKYDPLNRKFIEGLLDGWRAKKQ